MVRDGNGYLDETWLKATQYLLKVSGTPRNNQAQNRQVDEEVKKYKLSKEARRKLHDEISKQNLGFDEIMEEAKAISELGGKYVN